MEGTQGLHDFEKANQGIFLSKSHFTLSKNLYQQILYIQYSKVCGLSIQNFPIQESHCMIFVVYLHKVSYKCKTPTYMKWTHGLHDFEATKEYSIGAIFSWKPLD